MSEHRSGFVAVVGRPNVGKSTLLNHLIGQKVSIVTPKPQTTRNQIQCIYTAPGLQLVFLDTPGLHRPKDKLGEYMVKSAKESLREVDAVLFMMEASGWLEQDKEALAVLDTVDATVILVANKADLVNSKEIPSLLERFQPDYPFQHRVAISARTGLNMDELVRLIAAEMPVGPKYYPDDWVVNQPERLIVAEFVREQALLHLSQEVPHAVAVHVDEMVEDENRPLIRIRATLFVERDSQKGILIGKDGGMLKQIGAAARQQVERLLNVQVYLNLWVKVKKDWRKKRGMLKELGYK